MRGRAITETLVAVFALTLASCASKGTSSERPADASSSAPCDLLLPDDAAKLLGGPVEQIGFAEYLAATTTVPSEDQASVDAVARRICMYRSDMGEATVAIQVDRGMFEGEAQFRDAFEPEVEVLDDPGLAANYQSGSEASHLGVLLNEDGDSFDLRVSGAQVTKAEMTRAAAEIADRYASR